MKAYKLLRKRKDGTLGPLFINRKQVIPVGGWLDAEFLPRKGFAERCGFHCTCFPEAPHLSMKLATGEQRVWCEVEVEDFEYFERPLGQRGKRILAQRMKLLREISVDTTDYPTRESVWDKYDHKESQPDFVKVAGVWYVLSKSYGRVDARWKVGDE